MEQKLSNQSIAAYIKFAPHLSREELINRFENGEQYCLCCNLWKPLDEFGKMSSRRSGRHSKCKDCVRSQSRKSYHNRLESQHLRDKKRNKAKKQTLSGRFKKTREGAKIRNLEFSLTRKQFVEIVSGPCFYCGENEKKRGIDRQNNSVGYISSNCVSCCWKCNRMKNCLHSKEFIYHIKKILDYLEPLHM